MAASVDDDHYKDPIERTWAFSDALNQELNHLADAGCPVLQMEEPYIHMVPVRGKLFGKLDVKELAATTGHWRSAVLRDSPPPADVFLIFSKTTKGWTYEQSIGSPSVDSFKNSGSLVLAVARELIEVSKDCWQILEGPDAVTSKAK